MGTQPWYLQPKSEEAWYGTVRRNHGRAALGQQLSHWVIGTFQGLLSSGSPRQSQFGGDRLTNGKDIGRDDSVRNSDHGRHLGHDFSSRLAFVSFFFIRAVHAVFRPCFSLALLHSNLGFGKGSRDIELGARLALTEIPLAMACMAWRASGLVWSFQLIKSFVIQQQLIARIG